MKVLLKKTFGFAITLLCFGFSLSGFSQQDAQYTNYMYNTTLINPAYTGTREVMSMFALHRSQWVGLDGAPVTSAVSAHTPLGQSNTGLGVSFVNDQIGPSVENTISVDFAYRIPTGLSTLSFGIKGSANLLNVDYRKLAIHDIADPKFQNNVDNQFSPNVGAGLYWYSDNYYLGASVPNFLETKHYDDNASATAKERMHYYFMGGYVFDLNDNLKFKPAFLTKMITGAPLQVDLTANFMLHDKFVIGASYRWDAAVSFLAGFQLSKKFFLGYSYDTESTQLANYNSGSHEIFLRFELFRKQEKIYAPRFF
ncbi:hypothetical protein FLJC2902T_30610 [Flavobacterium limnosediminis JC2902]|uniref:Bacteroidetes-specific membrane protein n=1 Tax=Flavobacterium limnosediminis JC2902 TaxID=1341181 RepID=V6SGF0_9FLAO|nr:type IX secretion system membrane protein PorP/SprF [Flavobacterium limnosediminis]ESU25778.1 hypothetical protein FLJC2902T_30610 [Flavobacterium limnosediminis JC2902]